MNIFVFNFSNSEIIFFKIILCDLTKLNTLNVNYLRYTIIPNIPISSPPYLLLPLSLRCVRLHSAFCCRT